MQDFVVFPTQNKIMPSNDKDATGDIDGYVNSNRDWKQFAIIGCRIDVPYAFGKSLCTNNADKD